MPRGVYQRVYHEYIEPQTGKFCECGCGLQVRSRFISGHNTRVANPAFLPGISEKKSISQKKTIVVRAEKEPERHKAWLENVNNAVDRTYSDPVTFQRFSESMKIRRKTESFLEASRRANPKRSATVQSQWDAMTQEERMVRIQAIMRGASTRPNTKELLLKKILDDYFPCSFEMNVDKYKTIGGKVPDFISEEQKLVVEMFGEYWHSEELTGHSREVEEIVRVVHFAKFGYRTVIIWENELNDIPTVIRKVSLV
jgi:very-short-patch-repair endonuclease